VYSITKKIVARDFNVINREVFDNILDFSVIDYVDIDFLDTELGYCIDEGNEIILGLTDEFDSRDDFLNTLCHEMIHLYQILNDLGVNHGNQFKSMAKHSALFGYEVG